MRGRMVLSWEDGLNALVAEGIVAIVFRTVGDQCSLWESLLPEEVRRLPEELARVDALLDDPAFFAPFVPFFDPRRGRPSTPMEVYLRLMLPQVPLPPGLREPVPGGRGLDQLAPVLPDPPGRPAAASDNADEADHPLRPDGGRGLQRSTAGPRRRGQ